MIARNYTSDPLPKELKVKIQWTAWANKPRTVTLLLIGACFLVWAGGALDPGYNSESDLVTSVKGVYGQ